MGCHRLLRSSPWREAILIRGGEPVFGVGKTFEGVFLMYRYVESHLGRGLDKNKLWVFVYYKGMVLQREESLELSQSAEKV